MEKLKTAGSIKEHQTETKDLDSQSLSNFNCDNLQIEILDEEDVATQRFRKRNLKLQPLVTGFNFPIADEDTVELLEATVKANDRIREEYINYLRAKKSKSVGIVTVFHLLFSDESMYSYNYSGICNHGSGRKAMQNYTIFVDCMLEAWENHGIDKEHLKRNLNQVIKNINGRKRNRKYFAKRKVKNRIQNLESTKK